MMSGAFSGYNPALGTMGTASPIANNRATTATAHANSTGALGGTTAGILTLAVIAILVAAALLVTGRFTLSNIRIA